MFAVCLFLLPLVFLPILRIWAPKRQHGLRRLKWFSLVYLAAQALANAYLWYCYLNGYADWMIALTFPYLVAYLGLLIGVVLFFIGVAEKLATR